MRRVLVSLGVASALALTACAGPKAPGAGPSLGSAGPSHSAPSASPGCDKKNVCRVYVAMEKDPTGKEQIQVYPDAVHRTRRRDAHIVGSS